jgi:hypothetical protein
VTIHGFFSLFEHDCDADRGHAERVLREEPDAEGLAVPAYRSQCFTMASITEATWDR